MSETVEEYEDDGYEEEEVYEEVEVLEEERRKNEA
jgi:hypothetical protein